MTLDAQGWTIIFRDGVPREWQRAAQEIVRAGEARFTLSDATRAVRLGNGFLDLLLDESQAARLSRALNEAGFTTRELRWAECEAAELPQRHKRVDLDSNEIVPGLEASRVQFLHLVLPESAPFFLPPDAGESTRSAHRIAGALSKSTRVLGVEDFGVAGAIEDATGRMLAPGVATTSAPELIVELVGLWTPRVHLPVDQLDWSSVPGAIGGRRARLARLLELLRARLPHAQPCGLVEHALARRPLDGLRPTPSADHRRLVMAWLTARRLWPST